MSGYPDFGKGLAVAMSWMPMVGFLYAWVAFWVHVLILVICNKACGVHPYAVVSKIWIYMFIETLILCLVLTLYMTSSF